MKNYLSYIKENNSLITIPSIDELKELIDKHCKGFNPQNAIFYRGQYTLDDIFISKPSLRKRKSSFESEFVMAFTEHWKEYPKRKNSLCFTVSAHDAYDFGNILYYVLPFTDSNIGVSNFQDFNFQRFEQYSIHDVNELLKEFVWMVDPVDNINITYDEIITNLEKIDEDAIKNARFDPEWEEKYLGYYNSFDGDMVKFFEELIKPKPENYMNFKMDWNNIPEIGEGSELWTDGDCILIRNEIFEKEFNI